MALSAWIAEAWRSPDKKLRRRRLLGLAVLAALAYSVFGGRQGMVALGLSWREAWTLKREIARMQAENEALRQKAAGMARDRAFYEETAREKLKLRYPGEMVYRFEGQAARR